MRPPSTCRIPLTTFSTGVRDVSRFRSASSRPRASNSPPIVLGTRPKRLRRRSWRPCARPDAELELAAAPASPMRACRDAAWQCGTGGRSSHWLCVDTELLHDHADACLAVQLQVRLCGRLGSRRWRTHVVGCTFIRPPHACSHTHSTPAATHLIAVGGTAFGGEVVWLPVDRLSAGAGGWSACVNNMQQAAPSRSHPAASLAAQRHSFRQQARGWYHCRTVGASMQQQSRPEGYPRSVGPTARWW